jgi:hypothetical protein
MKYLDKALYAALLVFGLAGITSQPARAAGGTHWDAACNCRRPNAEYTTRRYVLEAPRVHTRQRMVNHTKVVKRTRLIQENRVIVHVRPIINREVIVHRQNTIVRNITLHRVNAIYKLRKEYRHETVHRYVHGWVHVVNEHRNVRGINCNCGGGEELVTYRN